MLERYKKMAKRHKTKKPKKDNSFLRLPSELRAPITTCHAVHKSLKDYDRKRSKRECRDYDE